MSYRDFTLDRACRAFTLTLDERADLFAAIADHATSPLLRTLLDDNVPLALAIHTEKARSELIVTPILLEVWRLMQREISLFSGIEFNVAPEKGLNGFCDFILSRSPMQLFLSAPVLTVVEAKNDNINAGLGQCVAQMVAARLFIEREGEGPTTIHGAVTTGSVWKFLKLDGGTVFVDRPEYYLDRVEKILAILLHCVGGEAPVLACA
jgi:hypothetical protein